MYGDYNWDIKIRGEVGKITRNVSNRKKPVLIVYYYCITLLHFMSDRPRCVPGQKMRYEAHKFRSVAVECRVAANPVTGLRFSWSFNGTAPKYAQKVSVPIRCIFAERS